MTTAELLRGAAAYIEKHGWLQRESGGAEFSDGRVSRHRPACAWGALLTANRIAHHGIEAHEMTVSAERALEKYLDIGPRCELDDKRPVPIWNDAPDRTKEEVVAALRGAAQALEEGKLK